jgi:hypothetical protein
VSACVGNLPACPTRFQRGLNDRVQGQQEADAASSLRPYPAATQSTSRKHASSQHISSFKIKVRFFTAALGLAARNVTLSCIISW